MSGSLGWVGKGISNSKEGESREPKAAGRPMEVSHVDELVSGARYALYHFRS